MINLNESMGPGRDQTRDPWNCCQTRNVTDCAFTAQSTLVSTFLDPDQLRPNVGLDTGPNGLRMLPAHAKNPRW